MEKLCFKWQIGYVGNIEWAVVRWDDPRYASIDAKELPIVSQSSYIGDDGSIYTSYDAGGANV